MKRRVMWVPTTASGSSWTAWYGGVRRGYVMRMSMGQYLSYANGRRARKYAPTMREAGKYVVAFVNSVSPSIIP